MVKKLHQTSMKQNKNKFSSNFRYLHAQNKLKRGKYTDATLEFNMTCTQDHVDKGLSYNIEISSLCPSKKEGFVNIANVSTCKQIIFVTQPQKQKVRMISVAGSSVANLVEMPSLAPFQDIVDVESPVVLHAKVSFNLLRIRLDFIVNISNRVGHSSQLITVVTSHKASQRSRGTRICRFHISNWR